MTKPVVRRQIEAEEILLQPIGRGFQTLEQQDVVSASQGSLPRNRYRGQFAAANGLRFLPRDAMLARY